MKLELRRAGSTLERPLYKEEPSKNGLVPKLLRKLGIAGPPRRFLVRIDHIPSPFPFAIVSGAEAEAALDGLARLQRDTTGVILGAPEAAAELLAQDRRKSTPSLSYALAELGRTDIDRWLFDRKIEQKNAGVAPPHGLWPSGTSAASDSSPSTIRDVLGHRELLPQVVVALIPTTEPSLAAIFLNFGHWNSSLSPAVHAAMAERWEHSYGAVPIAFSKNTVEFRVGRPVATRETAITLALEHFAYCPDIVLQGTKTIELLAASLIGARYWFFWWE